MEGIVLRPKVSGTEGSLWQYYSCNQGLGTRCAAYSVRQAEIQSDSTWKCHSLLRVTLPQSFGQLNQYYIHWMTCWLCAFCVAALSAQ